jgi:N-acetylglutamate synthase/N-acetylornithine aminotransferase
VFCVLYLQSAIHQKSCEANRNSAYRGVLTVSFFLQVDGDSSINYTLLALASGAAGGPRISNIHSEEARQLQAALDAMGLPTISGAQLLLPYYVLDRCCW